MSAATAPARRYWVIVPAAGAGRRMGQALPKQYLPLAGRTVIEWSLAPFLARADVAGIVVALAPGDARWPQLTLANEPRIGTCIGGNERADSVRAALAALQGRAVADDWVLVHDAARPCLASDDLSRLLATLADDPVGGLLAVPVADTLKRAADGHRVEGTVPRERLWRALTPQGFRYGVLQRALATSSHPFTDEAQAIEQLGLKPLLVPGRGDNLKITVPEDLPVAERILATRGSFEPGLPRPSEAIMTDERTETGTALRVGQGYDVHAFCAGDHVMLGGVRVPHDRGVQAHSDGDVVLHAVCDALLGAAGLGDIGMHFPDSDPRWRGVDSRHFVRHVRALVADRGFRVVNVDVTVLADAPRLGAHRQAMRELLAQDLGIDVEAANVKATTSEGLGFIGRREGLACQAVALIERLR